MFPNLNAEQARFDYTNQNVADYLGISRSAYEWKKKTGKFVVKECTKLCDLFKVNFDYLFSNSVNKPA